MNHVQMAAFRHELEKIAEAKKAGKGAEVGNALAGIGATAAGGAAIAHGLGLGWKRGAIIGTGAGMVSKGLHLAKKSVDKEKKAGEMQGHTRIGSKPIGVERLLEREREATDEGKTPSSIFDMPIENVVEKVSASTKALAALGLMGAGAVGYKTGENAVKDIRVGRQIRKAQRQQGY